MGEDKRHWHEISLVVPRPWSEVLPHFFEKEGVSGFWLDEENKPPHRLILRAYVPEGLWEPRVEDQLRAHLEALSSIFPEGSPEPELRVRLITEEDWTSKWLDFFRPLKVGTVWIRPGPKRVRLAADEQEIILDPGQAFGTGHHESTELCLESILLLRPALEDKASILDIGTGSGILAIFAAKVGFTNVLAIDTDPVAVETALRNIDNNELHNFVQVRTAPLESAGKRFDLILANLSASIHQDLAEELRLHMEKGAWLVAGGFLTGEADALIRTFQETGLELAHKKTKNDWGCLIFRSDEDGY